ncbi:hypothetical protein OBBRIDRAFT_792574 [Obba rivulosa]|uniref:Uncharacterized protein n=1 Tax=Obba rivulosa TaxID=1052685 RepID=A0A8E2AUD0_9APHY|nr:hypothetical protein OBBRIDRAFT_792574 [Obba rivulosa]
MADCLGECCAAFCGVCCIGCTQAIGNWSLFSSCGSGSSTGGGGCCGSCCKRSFDDDDFAHEEAKLNQRREAAKDQGQSGSEQTVFEQPAPRQSMEMRQNANASESKEGAPPQAEAEASTS